MMYFIVNTMSKSGKGKDIWKELSAYLKSENVEYKAWETKYEGHATKITSNLCACRKNIELVVVGGDGTVNEVINGITDFDRLRLAVIPTGSGNDFVRGLNQKGTPINRLKRILSSREDVLIDIGCVKYGDENKEKRFGISSGVGLDALVCKKTIDSKIKRTLNRLRMGNLTYIVLTIQSLFTMKTRTVRVQFDDDREKVYDRLIFFATMNFRAEGGGVPMAPNADASDGMLSICLAAGIPKWRTFLCLPILVVAKHERIKGFEIVNCRRCKLILDEPEVMHTDGEYVSDVTEVEYVCVNKQLRVMI